jgi:Ca-activated chloride channel homolog
MAVKDFGHARRTRFAFCGVFLFVALLLTGTSSFAQEPQPTPPPVEDDGVVDIKVDLVTLTLTVTDYYGRYVSGLTKDAFTVIDDGVEQEITFFSDADAPVSVGILFDVSGSMSGEKIRKARNALEAVLNKLTLVEPKQNTALYDACYLGVERVTRGAHQKKAILIISDGQDNASRYNFKEVRRLLKESDVTIYSVGIMDGRDAGSMEGMQGQAFLDELSSVTGGKSFYPNTNVELDEIFERIALELRHQYSVGYTPKNFQPDGKWHKVKVKVKPPRGLPRLTVRNREGYYATPNTNYP